MLKFKLAVEYVIDGSRGWYYQGDEHYDEETDEYIFFHKESCWCYFSGGDEIVDIHEYEEEN